MKPSLDNQSFKESGIPMKVFLLLKRTGLLPAVSRILKSQSRFRKLRARNKEIRFLRHHDIQDVFTDIYKSNRWENDESVSGSGSTLSYTENIRKALPELFAKFSIRSVFDAPCGDFNWMQCVLKDYPVDYTGGDIVVPLIEGNNAKYKSDKVKFIDIDLTKGKFPSADLMICRNCLFHLSYADAKAVLKNFIESDIAYLLTTTHINSGDFSNKDILTGSYKRIDLFSAPYNLPKDVLFRTADGTETKNKREICLWTKEQAVAALSAFGV